jgi:arylsulfatase A-like enzyme
MWEPGSPSAGSAAPAAGGPRKEDRVRRSVAIVVLGAFFLSSISLVLVTGPSATVQAGAATRAAASSLAARVAAHPNVVIILSDDQPMGLMSAMPRTRSRIFRRGTVFTQAYASNPLCCPSRATILTGGVSHTTGVYTNRGRSNGGLAEFARNGNEARTMAVHLDGLYETALFGKYLNGYRSYAESTLGTGYVPPGWDEWQAIYEHNADYFDYRLNVNGRILPFGSTTRDYSTDVLGRRFLDWLDPTDGDGRDEGQPFFALFAPYAPHLPARTPHARDRRPFVDLEYRPTPATNEADVSDKPAYIRNQPALSAEELEDVESGWIRQHQALLSLDRQVGRVMRYLEDSGEIRDTIVVYLSDNGLTWGDHRWTWKSVPYERSVRIPLAVRYDRLDGRGRGRTRDDLVSNADLFPTIMQLALGRGWTAPGPVDGRSLVPALREKARLRGPILLENLYVVRDERHRGAVPSYCGLITERWKYVVYSEPSEDPDLVDGISERELYDRDTDPNELQNLAASKPNVVAHLGAWLRRACSPPPPGWRAW